MVQDKIDELYDALKVDGLVEKDRDNFRNYMLASGEDGYRNRKALYDALKADELVSSASYEEFAQRLGLVPAGRSGAGASGGQSGAVAPGSESFALTDGTAESGAGASGNQSEAGGSGSQSGAIAPGAESSAKATAGGVTAAGGGSAGAASGPSLEELRAEKAARVRAASEKARKEREQKEYADWASKNTWLTVDDGTVRREADGTTTGGHRMSVAEYEEALKRGEKLNVVYDPREEERKAQESLNEAGRRSMSEGGTTDPASSRVDGDVAYYDIADPLRTVRRTTEARVLENPDDAYRTIGRVDYRGTERQPLTLDELVVKGERQFDTRTYEGRVMEEARRRVRSEMAGLDEKTRESLRGSEAYEEDFWRKVEEADREMRSQEIERLIAETENRLHARAETLAGVEINGHTYLTQLPENIDDDEMRALLERKKYLEKARDYIANVERERKGTAAERVGRGMYGALKETVTNFLGLPEYIDYREGVGKLIDKAKSGKPLSVSEQDAVSAFLLLDDVKGEYEHSSEYNMGEFAGAVAEFALEFGLNPASGLTRSVIANGCKRAGVSGFRALLKASPGVVNKLRVLGKTGGALMTEAGVLSATTQLPKNLMEIERRMMSVSADGKIGKGESLGKAAAKTFGKSVASDMIFLSHTGIGERLLKKMPGLERVFKTAVKSNPFNDPIDGLL